MIVLGLVGAALFGWVYYVVSRASYRPDPDGTWLKHYAVTFRVRYHLPKSCAVALAKGVRVHNQVFLALALAMPTMAVSTYLANPVTWGLLGASLLLTGIFAIPVLAMWVGSQGRPTRWLHPSSNLLTESDLP